MIERILNIGIWPENSDSLNRKIRICNLIALLSVVIISLYTPIYFFYGQVYGIVMNCSFIATSLLSVYLIHRRMYIPAFFFQSTTGYLYFVGGTLGYGVTTNLHFYMLAMCMIVTAVFDNKFVIRTYLVSAVVLFFGLVWWSYNFSPIVNVPEEMKPFELGTGLVNLFLLFVIISLFIIFFKNEMLLSRQRVLEQKNEIEEKNRDITDSILYARRIQTALLPVKNNLLQLFPGSFLFFHPKDIVSGDFYWLFENDRYRFLAVGDCTGHGVPGALMSVLGLNLLQQIVENKGIEEPAEILNELRSGIIHAFDKDGKSSEYKDGMDISLVRFSKTEQTFTYAAANNPVYHITENSLQELRGDRQAVGYAHEMKTFSQHTIPFEQGDSIVLFTDGFADQFGGPKGKKFKYSSFKELLEKSRNTNVEQSLQIAFEEWKGELEQVDDVCVVWVNC